MIIGHSMPKNITWSPLGAGADILSEVTFGSGRPDELTRFRWISGTQTTSSVLRIRATWPENAKVSMIYLANLSLPKGTKITVALRRAGDPVNTFSYVPTIQGGTPKIQEGSRGERTCCLIGTAIETAFSDIVGAEISIWNDVNGVASIPANFEFEIGEIAICEATIVDIDKGWAMNETDPTVVNYGQRRQPMVTPGVPYRQPSFKFCFDTQEKWLSHYKPLIAKIDRGKWAVYCFRYIDAASTFSVPLLHGFSMLGVLSKVPSEAHQSGQYFESTDATVLETPVPVP